MWILTARSPFSAHKEYLLKNGKNTLGRKPDNDIVIADDLASRLHTEIDCQPNQVIIQDLNSTNGTFVNRVRLTKPRVLKSEDQIRIGQHLVTLSFRYDHTTADQADPLSNTKPMKQDLHPDSVLSKDVLINE